MHNKMLMKFIVLSNQILLNIHSNQYQFFFFLINTIRFKIHNVYSIIMTLYYQVTTLIGIFFLCNRNSNPNIYSNIKDFITSKTHQTKPKVGRFL